MTTFIFPVRVYWEDTDAGGIVFHGQYINFAERARTEWVREVAGIESQQKFMEETGISFVVKNIEIDYKKTSKLDDILEISCEVIEKRNASIVFLQKITKDSEEIVQLRVKVATINEKGRPVRLPI